MRNLLIALALVLPQTAMALSCMPYSVETAYVEAREAKERYYVVRGALSFDPRKMPKVDLERQGDTQPMTHVPAELRGKALSKSGFAVPFDHDVTLAVACFGPWCADVPLKSDVLVFVRNTPEGYVIATNPCGGFLFADPNPAMIRAVKACFAGQRCVPLKR